MKKKQVELKQYLAPRCEVIALSCESTLLANSPEVRPGGGTGRVTIDPLNPDDGGDDDDIEAP